MRLTESEWQIMTALWQAHPATARELTGRLPEGVQWAHTTIKTLYEFLDGSANHPVSSAAWSGNLVIGTAVLARISVSAGHAFPDITFPDVIEKDELRPCQHHEGIYDVAKTSSAS